MKKAGFTLAEVLITLAIIGVVATMTLPALMTNTQEQQAKTGLKKGINTLTEAAQSNLAIEGFDFGNIKEDSDDDATKQSIAAILQNRTQVNYQMTDFSALGTNGAKVDEGATSNLVVFLRDGSAISFPKAKPADTAFELLDDALPRGIAVMYDYNGLKKPNQLSNCNNKPALTAKDGSDVSTACTKANKVIKDQFGLRLRGSYVVPNGAAARWAYDN